MRMFRRQLEKVGGGRDVVTENEVEHRKYSPQFAEVFQFPFYMHKRAPQGTNSIHTLKVHHTTLESYYSKVINIGFEIVISQL